MCLLFTHDPETLSVLFSLNRRSSDLLKHTCVCVCVSKMAAAVISDFLRPAGRQVQSMCEGRTQQQILDPPSFSPD